MCQISPNSQLTMSYDRMMISILRNKVVRSEKSARIFVSDETACNMFKTLNIDDDDDNILLAIHVCNEYQGAWEYLSTVVPDPTEGFAAMKDNVFIKHISSKLDEFDETSLASTTFYLHKLQEIAVKVAKY